MHSLCYCCFFIDFPLHSPGFSIHAANADNNDEDNDEDIDDEEDYSVSVSAIMQRRASVRGYRRKSSSRNSRRASSPMDHVLDNAERRRSSVYTTSSGMLKKKLKDLPKKC